MNGATAISGSIPTSGGSVEVPSPRAAAPSPLDPKLIDEYAVLEARIRENAVRMKGSLKLFETLKKKIRAAYMGQDAEAVFLAEGHQFLIEVGPRENERVIADMEKLAKLVGMTEFFARCSFTLRAAEELLDEAQLAQVILSDRTGTRPLKAVRKAIPDAA